MGTTVGDSSTDPKMTTFNEWKRMRDSDGERDAEKTQKKRFFRKIAVKMEVLC